MYKNKRILYLVKHLEKPIFKIGIATDNSRFEQLKLDYSIDWKYSIYFEGENKHIVHMEKILQALFEDQQQILEEGTGRTEWFSVNYLDNTLKALHFNVKISNYNICLEPKKIIFEEKPIKPKKKKKKKLKNPLLEKRKEILSKYPTFIVGKWEFLDRVPAEPDIVYEMLLLIPETMEIARLEKFDQQLYDAYVKERSTPLRVELFNFILNDIREKIDFDNLSNDRQNDILSHILDVEEISKIIGMYDTEGTIMHHLKELERDHPVFICDISYTLLPNKKKEYKGVSHMLNNGTIKKIELIFNRKMAEEQLCTTP